MNQYSQSGYRNDRAKKNIPGLDPYYSRHRNVKLVNRRDLVLWFACALIVLGCYSLARGW